MKKTLLMLILGIGAIFVLGGCEDDVYIFRPDHTPPSVPKGLYSITADEAVYLYWEENDESDFKEYRVYRKVEGDDYYYRIASTKAAEHVDWDVNNGITYFYAVTARDRHGNEINHLFQALISLNPRFSIGKMIMRTSILNTTMIWKLSFFAWRITRRIFRTSDTRTA
jgi:hypothetical protein